MKTSVNVGSVVVQRVLHVPPRMKGKSLQRFKDSQAYKKEISKDASILSSGIKQGKIIGETKTQLEVLWKDGTKSFINKDSTSGLSPETKKMASATRTQKQDKNAAATTKATPAKKGAKKVAAKKVAKKAAAKATPAKKGTPAKKTGGKIEAILNLHLAGKSNKEIIEAGYNKSTVSIQVSGYKNNPKAYSHMNLKKK